MKRKLMRWAAGHLINEGNTMGFLNKPKLVSVFKSISVTIDTRRKAEESNIHCPIDLHGRPQLSGNLFLDFVAFAVHHFHRAEKHGGENGGPKNLVDSSL